MASCFPRSLTTESQGSFFFPCIDAETRTVETEISVQIFGVEIFSARASSMTYIERCNPLCTVTSEISFRFLLTVHLSVDPPFGLLGVYTVPVSKVKCLAQSSTVLHYISYLSQEQEQEQEEQAKSLSAW